MKKLVMVWQVLVLVILTISFIVGMILYYLSKVCRGVAFFLLRRPNSAKEEFRNWGQIGDNPLDF